VLPNGVPAKVARILRHIDKTGEAPPGYEGGRSFGNYENHLPKKDRYGKRIRYQEWDVNPKVRGKNRGAERLVTGSNHSAYYSRDHYRTFIQIR
jgi:ribonuclease T1